MQRSSVKSVDVNDIDNLLGKIQLIDIREPYEYKGGHLPSAKNIPMDTILANPDKYLDKTTEYHIICHSGSRISMACNTLKKKALI
jgi:rhodanese-related sulfurtransferase